MNPKGGPSAPLIPGQKIHKKPPVSSGIVSSTKLCHSFYHKPENLTTLFYFPFSHIFTPISRGIPCSENVTGLYEIFSSRNFSLWTKQQNFLPVRLRRILSPFHFYLPLFCHFLLTLFCFHIRIWISSLEKTADFIFFICSLIPEKEIPGGIFHEKICIAASLQLWHSEQ